MIIVVIKVVTVGCVVITKLFVTKEPIDFSAAAAVFVVSMLSSLVSKREHYVSKKHVMNVTNVSFQT